MEDQESCIRTGEHWMENLKDPGICLYPNDNGFTIYDTNLDFDRNLNWTNRFLGKLFK